MVHMFVLAALACLAWQAAPSPPPHPIEMQAARLPLLVDPPSIDFGRVAPGTKHPARFTLRNAGSEPLTIAKAVPSCKCTDVSDIVGRTIAPGASLELSAALLVPKSPGEKDAKVMISVEGKPGLVVARMVADVTQPVRSAPAYVDALRGAQGGTIRLSSVDGKPFRVTSAGGKAPSFVGFDPAVDAPRAEYEVSWTLAGLGQGQLPQWWVIDTDREDCPQVPLRVRHETTGFRFDMERNARFWFPPESIVLAGKARAGTPVTLTTTIEHQNPAAQGLVTNPAWSEVRALSVPGGEGTAQLVSVAKRPGDFADVSFTFTPAAGRSGPMYVPVVIETATGKGPVFVAVTVIP